MVHVGVVLFLSAKVASLVPELPMMGALPPDFNMLAAELFFAMGMFDRSNGFLLECFFSSPPPGLSQTHLLFAMGRLFEKWEVTEPVEGMAPGTSGRGAQSKSLYAQAYALAAAPQPAASVASGGGVGGEVGSSSSSLEGASLLTESTAWAGPTPADLGSEAPGAEPPPPANAAVAAWLDLGATWRTMGDGFSTAGFHLLAKECYSMAVLSGDDRNGQCATDW
jgi:hypothetical protein